MLLKKQLRNNSNFNYDTSSTSSKRNKSVTHKLFLQQKESFEQLLIRKFKTKYIDNNPLFEIDQSKVQKIFS